MTTSEYIFKWLEDNKDFFKVQSICKKLGIDKGNFSKYKSSKSLPQKYIIPIYDIIIPLGFKIESNGQKEANKNTIKDLPEETMPEGLNWKERIEWTHNFKQNKKLKK